MPNLTIALDGALLARARRYASQQGTTVNRLIRELLSREVSPRSEGWVEEFDRLTRQVVGDSGGGKFSREEMHQRGRR